MVSISGGKVSMSREVSTDITTADSVVKVVTLWGLTWCQEEFSWCHKVTRFLLLMACHTCHPQRRTLALFKKITVIAFFKCYQTYKNGVLKPFQNSKFDESAPWLGGLGIFDPCKSAQDNYEFSVSVASPLASAILNQLSSFDCSIVHQQHILKQEALSLRHPNSFSSFLSTLSTGLQLSLKLACEIGAFSWLSTLPLVLLFIRVIFVM